DQLELLLDQIEELQWIYLFLAVGFANLVVRRPQKVGIGDTRYLDRVLEGEEDSVLRSDLGILLEQVLAVVADGSAGDFIGRISGENLGERRFAGAIR